MPIRLIIARTSAEKDAVHRLRHKVFVEQEGRFARASGSIVDRYDCFAESYSILAYDGDTAVGTIRVTLDSPVGLPPEESFDFAALRRENEGAWCSCNWLCTLQSHRHHPGLTLGMFKLAVRKMRQAESRHVIMTIHPPVLKLLALFGAKPVGEVFQSAQLGVPVLPCHIDTDAFPSGARESFEDPVNDLLDDSDERRIYRRDEVIFREGEPGEEALFVMRGSVQLTSSADGGAPGLLVGQGNLLGEISVLDGGPQPSTVKAYSQEVDVMVWRRDQFMDQLRASRERSLALTRLLASRLRRNAAGAKGSPPTALLARILLDASRGGARPVCRDWLSRQCGLWLADTDVVVSEWHRKGWVTEGSALDLLVTDAAMLSAVARS